MRGQGVGAPEWQNRWKSLWDLNLDKGAKLLSGRSRGEAGKRSQTWPSLRSLYTFGDMEIRVQGRTGLEFFSLTFPKSGRNCLLCWCNLIPQVLTTEVFILVTKMDSVASMSRHYPIVLDIQALPGQEGSQNAWKQKNHYITFPGLWRQSNKWIGRFPLP